MLALSESVTGRSPRGDATAAHLRALTPLDIIPFEPWHLRWLTATTEQAWIARTPDYGAALKAAGPCFSAFAGLTVIACAGVTHCWEGRAQAWSMLSDEVGRYRFGVHRAVARFLNDYPVTRVECTVDPRSPMAIRWAVRLGFHYEGTMTAYTPAGDTMDLYARIRR